MRRDHRQPAGPRPFDLEADRPADVTQEFWGATRDWEPRPDDGPGDAMWAERTGSMRTIRDGLTAFKPRRGEPTRSRRGGMDRTRSHGIVRPRTDDTTPTGQMRRVAPEATLAELAAGRRAAAQRAQIEFDWPEDDDWTLPATSTGRHGAAPPANPVDDEHYADEADLIPLSPAAPLVERLGLGGVDPLLLRLGAIVLIGVLAVPFAIAGRGGSGDAVASANVAAAVATAAPSVIETGIGSAAPQTVAPAPALAAANPAPAAAPVADQPAVTPAAAEAPDAGAATDVATDDGADAPTVADVQDVAIASTSPPEVAVVSENAERVEPQCDLVYTAVAGDSWYRVADRAGVSMQAVLDANLAGVESVILPGDEICLPDGANLPSPPTTAAPVATAAPTTTAAPATTRAPSTATTPPPPPASAAEVQSLIREIWPDELEERALEIAWRESNYRSNAYNGSCCYGVFQIHWPSHRGWLDDYGIVTSNDLFDARKNITASYALYQRAGGWGPWGG